MTNRNDLIEELKEQLVAIHKDVAPLDKGSDGVMDEAQRAVVGFVKEKKVAGDLISLADAQAVVGLAAKKAATALLQVAVVDHNSTIEKIREVFQK